MSLLKEELQIINILRRLPVDLCRIIISYSRKDWRVPFQLTIAVIPRVRSCRAGVTVPNPNGTRRRFMYAHHAYYVANSEQLEAQAKFGWHRLECPDCINRWMTPRNRW